MTASPANAVRSVRLRGRNASGALRRARTALARIPRVGLLCALVGFLNAASWSILMPAFQTPDEVVHFSYVQEIAEAGRLPSIMEETYNSPELELAIADLYFDAIRFDPTVSALTTDQAQRRLLRDLDGGPTRRGNGGAGAAAYGPPLYYALESLPYRLGSGGNVLDRLALMRLLSALMGAFTILFVFLFLRETFPGTPWAWTIGALGAAFTPLFAQMSGSVNPDALLYAASAGVFCCLARGFRRGLTAPLAVATGLALAVGFLAKTNFIGVVPGAVLGLLLIGRRHHGGIRWGALRLPAVALAAALVPIAAVGLFQVLVYDRPIIGGVSQMVDSTTSQHGTLLGELGYLWQFYLPPLPGMEPIFPSFSIRYLWVNGFVSRFGWLDTIFASWVRDVALGAVTVAALLLIRSTVAQRQRLRQRHAELLTYAAMTAGLLTLIGMASYTGYLAQAGGGWGQSRYMLPLMPLFAAAAVMTAFGAGRRWASSVGTAIVVVVIAHDLFSQLLVVSRYYA